MHRFRRQEGREDPGRAAELPEQEALDEEQQPDRGHQLHLGAGPGQVAGQPGDRHTAEDADTDDRHHQRHRPRPAMGRAQLEEGVRPEGGDGAVGEVEDAGRAVRQDEADAGQAVDGAGRQADDEEGQEILHAADTPTATSSGRHTPQATRPARRSKG